MDKPVKLTDLVDGLQSQSDQVHAFLDRRTGEVVEVSEEYLDMAEDADAGEITEWEKEEVELAKAVLENDEYLPLPDRYEIDEYRMMKNFAEGQEDERARDQLRTAIQGRGAFRYFKDTAARLRVIDAWYRYRDGELRDIAVRWCEANGIAFI